MFWFFIQDQTWCFSLPHQLRSQCEDWFLLGRSLHWIQVESWWWSLLWSIWYLLSTLQKIEHHQVISSWNKICQWHLEPNYFLCCCSTFLPISHTCLFCLHCKKYGKYHLIGQIGHNHDGSYPLQWIPPPYRVFPSLLSGIPWNVWQGWIGVASDSHWGGWSEASFVTRWGCPTG